MSELTRFDAWLTDGGPAALVIRQPLTAVEGNDGVVFPATFASGDGFAGGYNIDVFPDEAAVGRAVSGFKSGQTRPTIEMFPSSKNVCLIDSVGSQANRIEPLFMEEAYRSLVPQVTIKAGEKTVNLLEAGHRAGDAIVRCSTLQEELRKAFLAALKGNAEPLAKVAPTSLLFGVWDSRDTQAKMPRLLSSTIRAFNVQKLTRSAQYVPAMDYVAEKQVDAPPDKPTADAHSERGFSHVPATATHGGVIATGGIRRDATFSLAALRLLAVREAGGVLSTDKTLALRRYILGLGLVAFTASRNEYLRQGCMLVPDIEKAREFVVVNGDGNRSPSDLTHDQALAYAKAAAAAFGVGADKAVTFEKERATKDIKGEDKPKKGGKGAKKEQPPTE